MPNHGLARGGVVEYKTNVLLKKYMMNGFDIPPFYKLFGVNMDFLWDR